MGKFKFLALSALAALMLPACSSDPLAEAPDDPNEESEGISTDEGYINISINLPTRNTESRAGDQNDQYDDGLESEYKVNNGYLILFDSNGHASPAYYTFHSAYNLTPVMLFDHPENNNVTVRSVKIQSEKGVSNTLKALVILNGNEYFTFDGTTAKLNGTTLSNSNTFNDFLTAQANQSNLLWGTTPGFFMTNSILSSQQGHSAPPSTFTSTSSLLVDFNMDGVYKTEAEAAAGSIYAVDVYVERAAVKIELVQTNSNMAPTLGATGNIETGYSLVANVTGWKIVNQEPKSYLVRSWDDNWFGLCSNATPDATNDLGANNMRFAGKTQIDATGKYRTYFGKDEHYNTDLSSHVSPVDYITELGSGKPQYCYENTFDVTHMLVKNTTCLVLEVTFKKTNDGGTTLTPVTNLYRIGDDHSKVYELTQVKNAVATEALKFASIKDVFGQLYSNPAKTFYMKVTDVVFGTRDANGVVPVTSVTFNLYDDEGCSTPATGAYTDAACHTLLGSTTKTISASTIINNINNNIKVYDYPSGKSYYTVLIKHFGDDLTPWKSTETPAPSVADSYPSTNAEANYLGRFGVVRNNWYVIEATGIKQIGKATDPTDDLKTDDTPDDNLESYIKTRINVLSWAKRTQSVVLD